MTASLAFTAAAIARALDKAPCSIRRTLDEVPHTSPAVVNGREVKAWALDALPKSLREELDVRAAAQNFRDAASLLQSDGTTDSAKDQKLASLRDLWKEAADSAREKAIRLQRALAPSLERYDAGEMAGVELERRGLDDYARQFGHKGLSPRTFRFLFQRARDRARSPADYAAPHLFLDENCARRRESLPALKFDDVFGPLHQLITGFTDPTEPTPTELEALWAAACEMFQPHSADRRFKSALLNFLWHFAPRLALTKEALRVNFGRKFQQMLTSGSVADLRRRAFIVVAAPSAEKVAQINLLAANAGVNHGGHVAPAKVELQALGLYPADEGKSKSYVSATDRRLARRKARIVAMAVGGPRRLRELTPTLTRDPLTCFANDIFTGDDFTMPILTWQEADNDLGFSYGNGQTLIMSDFATWCVLAFSLQPESQYNSHVVKTLLTRAAMEHGLPSRLYFERGQIWEHSKILKGDDERAGAWHDAHSDAEFVYGLQTQLGIRFMHARSPEAKSQIERLGGMLQDLMFGEPGYTGRDQRVNLPERTRREIAQVKSGVHPSKFWHHIDDWRKRLKELITQYNHTRQEGRWLAGLSPHDAFVKRQRPNDPPTKLDANSWPILACQKRRHRVREDGMISFRLTGVAYNYFNEETTIRLGGEMVLLHWNPETPEFIGVTDLHGRDPILVPRVMDTHAFDTDDLRTQAGLAVKARCAAALKAQYETLPVKAVRQFRPTIVSRDSAALAQQMTARKQEMTTEKRDKNTLRRRAHRALERAGLPLAMADISLTEDSVRGFEDMAETTNEETT